MRKLSKNEYLAVFVGLAVVLFIFVFNGMPINIGGTSFPGAAGLSGGQDEGLIIQDTVVGTGAVADPGKVLVVNYTCALQDGTMFDSSASHGAPYPFTLGVGEVIKGWDQGLLGMKVGGKRVIIVPPSLGYGDRQKGPIPPNSTLIFTVELLEVKDAVPEQL